MLQSPLLSLSKVPPVPSIDLASGRITEEHLVRVLLAGGALPISAGVAGSLRAAAEGAGGGRAQLSTLVETVLLDPVLTLRLIVQVNRAFYQRSTPTTSITEAVKLLGTRRLVAMMDEVATSLPLSSLQNAPLVYTLALQEQLAAAEFARGLYEGWTPQVGGVPGGVEVSLDAAQVMVALLSAPLLALAWIAPESYAWIHLAASGAEAASGGSTALIADPRSMGTPMERVFGMGRAALSLGIARALRLPEEFQRLLGLCTIQAQRVTAGTQTPEGRSAKLTAGIAFFATEVAHEYQRFSGRQPFELLIPEAQQRLGLPGGTIALLLQRLYPEMLRRQERAGCPGLPFPEPELFVKTSEGAVVDLEGPAPTIVSSTLVAFMEEIKRSLAKLRAAPGGVMGEGSSGLSFPAWLTMQALVRVLHFERAAILGVNFERGELVGIASAGVPHAALQKFRRSIQSQGGGSGPEMRALVERKAISRGVPITPDGSQACAFPIIHEGLVQGVFYAERLGGARSAPQPLDLQMLVVTLAESWQDI